MLAAVVLAQLVDCAPAEGQIRWSGITYTVNAGGQTLTLQGSLWDRDHSGKPSKGDLFRVDEGEQWFLVGAGLVGGLAAQIKQQGEAVTATCVSHFQIEDVPVVQNPAALAKLLGGGGGAEDPVARLNGQMRAWAEEICAQKKHYEEAQLAELLVQKAAPERGFKASTLRREAQTVARDFGMKCTHLVVPKVTFE